MVLTTNWNIYTGVIQIDIMPKHHGNRAHRYSARCSSREVGVSTCRCGAVRAAASPEQRVLFATAYLLGSYRIARVRRWQQAARIGVHMILRANPHAAGVG